MRSLILLFTFVVVISPPALSQELQRMGGGGVTIGYGFLDVSALHRFTPSAPSFSNSHLLIGGEGHGFIGRLVVGGAGQGIIANTVQTDSLKVSLGGGMGTFDLGYLLVSKDKMKIFPMLGIGSGGYGISISKNHNVSLAKVAEDPAMEIRINKANFIVDLSINVNFIPLLTEDEDDDRDLGGPMVGFKAGALLSPKGTNWSYTGGDVTGGPAFGMNMFYFKMVVGGFGGKKKK